MDSKEVTRLRKSGSLDQALGAAKELLEADSDNIWNRRAAAWVYYDCLKKYCSALMFDDFFSNLKAIKALELGDDDTMVYDNVAWQVGKMLMEIRRSFPDDTTHALQIWEMIKDFHFSKPDDAYSFILSSLHKILKDDPHYIEMVDWWGLESLSDKDKSFSEYNGRRIMSLLEQVIINYSKRLLESYQTSLHQSQGGYDPELKKTALKKIKDFMPRLESIVETYPSFQYPPYYLAKFLLVTGDQTNSLSAFLPFARKKQHDFWVWELLSEMFPNDNEQQIACYCKALSLNNKEDFLVKLRSRFAVLLKDKGFFDEAKVELDQSIQTRVDHGWKVPQKFEAFQQEDWYKKANPKKDNQEFYSAHKARAEALLFHDIEEEPIVVEFVNKDKKILNFVQSRSKHGFFKYAGLSKTPQIGDVLLVRLKNKADGDSRYQALTVKFADEHTSCEALMTFMDKIKIRNGQDFGFVKDIFVAGPLLKQEDVKDGQLVSGRAILSYNKKKETWGMKAISIEKQVELPF